MQGFYGETIMSRWEYFNTELNANRLHPILFMKTCFFRIHFPAETLWFSCLIPLGVNKVLKPIHTEWRRKQTFILMFVVYSSIFFASPPLSLGVDSP